MRVLAASALAIGGAAAWSPFNQVQQVLQAPHRASEILSKPLADLSQSLKSLTKEARIAWDEVSLLYPEAMEQVTFFSAPKKHTRKPDSHWDHIIRGADVQSVWVENADGEQERDVDGKLEAYDLRTKKADPGVLGVDNVTQYSGYLDDNENDKHLFYCMCRIHVMLFDALLIKSSRVLRVPQ